MSRTFLTAEWRHLVMLNYRVAPELLRPHVPYGTELDSWQDACYLSVVGFLFRDTAVLGVPVPFHREFEEVNLRFYVRREEDREVRRAVTFFRELVPRRLVAAVARLSYNEPYLALPMGHRFESAPGTGDPATVEYSWRANGAWAALAATAAGTPAIPEPGSHEEFITEHYWGYTRQRDGGTIEYRVDHPRWRVWSVHTPRLEGDVTPVFGAAFADELSRAPDSAFLADGSAIRVSMPRRVRR